MATTSAELTLDQARANARNCAAAYQRDLCEQPRNRALLRGSRDRAARAQSLYCRMASESKR